MQGPWEQYASPAAPPPPSIPRVIQGGPREATPQTPEQRANTQATTQHTLLENQNLERQNRLRTEATTAQADEAQNVLRAIDQARGNTGWWSTGVPGQVLSNVGGTEAHDLSANIDTVTANIGFDRLQQMRNASPTGGALGQVSDFENRMLQSSLTSLRQSQTQEQFRQNLDAVELHYLNVISLLNGQPPAHDLNEARTRYRPDSALGASIPSLVGQPPANGAPPATPTPGRPPGSPPLAAGSTTAGPSGATSPAAQHGPIEFGVSPHTPSGFEQAQIEAYDSFWRNNPRASLEQFRAAFPNVSNAEEIISARDQGAGVLPGSTWVLARPNEQPVDVSSARGGSPEATARAVTENQISSGIPLVGPLISADQTFRGPEAANALLHGGQDWAMFGTRDEASAGLNALLGRGSYDQNVNFERGVDAFDNQNFFYDRLGGQVAAGLPEALLPGGLAAQAARSGAQGTLYGFGSGEGGFSDRAPNALLGGTIGAVAPPLLAAGGVAARAGYRGAANALRPTVTDEGRTVAQAAQQEGVRISRPVAEPSARDRMMHLEASRGSGDLIREPLANTASDIEQRAGQIGGVGTVEEPGTMGQRVQGAGQRFIQDSRGTRDRLYTRAANLAGDATVEGRDAVAALDQHLADLAGNPSQNAAEIAFLRSVRSDLVDAQGNLIPKTVAQIRDIRTGLRGRVSNANLLGTRAESRVLDVLEAARSDISRDLSATAPRAVAAYARADAYNTARHREIEQVIQRVIGPKNNPISGEQVWAKFRSMAGPRGDSAGMARLWARLSSEEQRDAAATLAQSAGRRSPEDDFSPALFVGFARSLSPAAARTIFGPEGASSIANLRLLSRALVQTEKRLNNSRSGAVSNWRESASRWREVFGGLLGSVTAATAGSGSGTAIAAAAGGAALGMASRSVGVQVRRLSARALMNPDMSRWLATGARLSTPQAIRSHIGRLTAIASRDPAIAQEVLALRQSLARAANDNFSSAAAASGADGEPQSGNGEPGSPPR